MMVVNPSCWPTAKEAIKSIQEYHDGFTRAQLKCPIPETNYDTMSMEEPFKRMQEANEWQAVREKKFLVVELVQILAASS